MAFCGGSADKLPSVGVMLWIFLTAMMLGGCSNSNQQQVSFSAQVLPLLLDKCMPCHADGGIAHQRIGLLLDSHTNLMRGSNNGPIITPGNTSKSPISVFIHPSPDATMQMPLGGKNKLTKTENSVKKT